MAIRSWADVRERLQFFYGMSRRAEAIYSLMAKEVRRRELELEKAEDPKKLAAYGYTAYSMADEDGIVEEIFRRIGTTNKQFVEFGCGDGLENNSTYLLYTGWSGLWMDGGEANIASVERHFGAYLEKGQLQAKRSFLTKDNINDLIGAAKLERVIDFISIDIDGNDYWLWEALHVVEPRVVAIEYNGTFRPPHKIVQRYKEDHRWNGSNFFGASLKALEELGRKKGYELVGCNYSGINAFFVKKELAAGKFSEPFTAEHHYRAPNYDSHVRGYSRHARGAGDYIRLP
jgi:hypothetical protein